MRRDEADRILERYSDWPGYRHDVPMRYCPSYTTRLRNDTAPLWWHEILAILTASEHDDDEREGGAE